MPSRIPSGQILKCADPVVEVGVEKIIVHPDYNDKSRDKMHDIALLRLNTNVTYSKYIKPICLPVAGLSSGLITGNKLSVAGWGSTNGMHFSHTHQMYLIFFAMVGRVSALDDTKQLPLSLHGSVCNSVTSKRLK